MTTVPLSLIELGCSQIRYKDAVSKHWNYGIMHKHWNTIPWHHMVCIIWGKMIITFICINKHIASYWAEISQLLLMVNIVGATPSFFLKIWIRLNVSYSLFLVQTIMDEYIIFIVFYVCRLWWLTVSISLILRSSCSRRKVLVSHTAPTQTSRKLNVQ